MKKPIDLYIVAGNITVFCGEHSDAFKTDLLQSTLYSHLLATKSTNNRELYWSTYTRTLGNLAWVHESNIYSRIDSSPDTLLNIIINYTRPLMTDSARESLADSFSQLATLPHDSPALQRFLNRLQANSISTHEVSVPRAPAKKTTWGSSVTVTIIRENRSIITTFIAFQTTTTDKIGILDGALVKLIKDDKNNMMVSSSSLDETNYCTFRNAIAGKVHSKINTELVHVQSPSTD